MHLNLQVAKKTLRDRVRAELKKLSPKDRATNSAQARAILAGQALWRGAQAVLFFAPLPEELDLWPLLPTVLAEGKTVGLPCFNIDTGTYVVCRIRDAAADLRTGRFGIREPNELCSKISWNQRGLILVPGVAFDLRGSRVGRGRGYYDRLLAVVPGPKCAVAFDQQIVDEIPLEEHDIRMDYILTPTRWIEV
jgi:5-formyltetrahydrofolate cyclo-ligase